MAKLCQHKEAEAKLSSRDQMSVQATWGVPEPQPHSLRKAVSACTADFVMACFFLRAGWIRSSSSALGDVERNLLALPSRSLTAVVTPVVTQRRGQSLAAFVVLSSQIEGSHFELTQSLRRQLRAVAA